MLPSPASIARRLSALRKVRSGAGYLELLDRIHAHVRPRTYVEIGVRHGGSLARALPDTLSVGIDPALDAADTGDQRRKLFALTSDDFFARHDMREVLEGLDVDLAFVDGMHLFEFALRDFANLERLARPDSVILVHDCLPIDAVTSAREQTTDVWTGDVWKLVPCLLETRPDLHIVTSDVRLSGMVFITRLDPGSSVLDARREELERRWIDVGYDWLDGDARTRLRVSRDAWERTHDVIRSLA
jgi:Methyltransferase domain